MSTFSLTVKCARCSKAVEANVSLRDSAELHVAVCSCASVAAPPPSGVEALAIRLAANAVEWEEEDEAECWGIQSDGWKEEFLDQAKAYAKILWPELKGVE